MIVLKILILFLPLLILVEANLKIGPFHRSPPTWIPQHTPIVSTNSPVDERELKISPQPTSSKHEHTDADRHTVNNQYHSALIPSSPRVPLIFSTNPSVDDRTPPSVQVRPVTPDATEKSVSVEPDTVSPKITSESPVEIQTAKPAPANLPHSEYTDNGRQVTSPYHVRKPASRPWSPPKLPKLQSKELSKLRESQPITMRPASIVYQTPSPITSMSTEKYIPIESITSPSITSTDSAVEIQTPKSPQSNKLLSVYTDNIPQNTRLSYINKLASSPWSPQKFTSLPSVGLSMERGSQPINVRPASSIYQTPAQVTLVSTEKSVPTESTTLPSITSTDSAIEMQTLKPPQSNKLLPVYADSRPQNTRISYINKPASSPWSPPKFATLPSVELSMQKASQPVDVRPVSYIDQTPEQVTPISIEKSVPTESTTLPSITSTDSAIEMQTLKPPQSNKLLPVYADSRPQNTRISYINKPASSPWSPPKFATLPSVGLSMQKASQPVNVRPVSYIYQTPARVTPVSTEKSVPTESTTSSPITFMDSEIQTPKPLRLNRQHLLYADNVHQDTYHIPKPASNSWNPPSMLWASRAYGYRYQISKMDKPVPTEISSAQNVPANLTSDRKKFSVNSSVEMQTLKPSLTNSVQHINADDERMEPKLHYIPRPASSPWMPRESKNSSSSAEIQRVSQPNTPQSMYLGEKRHMETGPYHRPQRSANPWDLRTSDSFVEIRIPQNDTLQATETTDPPVRKVLHFICPQPHGYFKYSDQCDEYIECKNYIPLAYACPVGLHFNPQLEWTEYPCDYPSKVQCNKESSPLTTTKNPQPAPTQSPKVVNTTHPSTLQPEYIICPQQNGYFKFTDHCGVYIECKNHLPLMFTCPVGLHFNPLAQWTEYPCDYPSNVKCDYEETPRPTTEPTTIPPPLPTTTSPPSLPTTRRPPPPPTTRRPPTPTTRRPPPPPTTRRPPPPPTTRRPPPPPTTRRPPPPPTTRRPPPPTTRRPPPPPTTRRPPPPPTTRRPPPPTTRRPSPPTTRRPPPPPPTTRRPPPPPPPTTRRPPPPPPTTRRPPPPPPTTRRPPPPPTTRRPPPTTWRTTPSPPPSLPTTAPPAVITPGPKNPPDYNICLQPHGYFKFNDKCGEYIECKNYVPLVFACPFGLQFNPLAEWTEYPCDHPSKVQCDGEPVIPEIPSTTQPPIVSTTEYPTVTTPHPGSKLQDFKCPQAHGYFKHNDKCSEYIECKNHTPLTYTCPDGLHFDIYIHWTQYPCVDPANVQCDKEPDTKKPTENPNTTIRSDVETQQPTATPQSTVVTPRPNVVTPRSTVVTPRSTVVTQQPAVVTRQPTTATPYIPNFSTEGTLRPTTERHSHELVDFYCPEPNSYYSVASECDTYVECKSYIAIQHYCPAGLHFNPKAQWPNPPCDYPSKVQCNTEHFNDPDIPSRPIWKTPRPTDVAPRPTKVTHRPIFLTPRPTMPHAHDITRLPREPATPIANPPPSKQYFNYSCSESNGFYSVASECDVYVECKNDTAIKYSCPDGLHFNPNAQWPDYPCGYPSEVKCSSGDVVRHTVRLVPFKVGEDLMNIFGDVGRNSSMNKSKSLAIRECEDWSYEEPANPTDECPHRDGFFPTNNGDCGEYMVCHAGVAVIKHCPAGLVFNFEKDTCDWPINVPNCNTPKVLEGFVCPAQPADKEGLIYKYRHGRSCKDFVACHEGQPRLLSCDAGLHFDEKTESCMDSTQVVDCEA